MCVGTTLMCRAFLQACKERGMTMGLPVFLLAGAGAGGMAAAVTTPMDVVKTRHQTAMQHTALLTLSAPTGFRLKMYCTNPRVP